MSTNGLSIYKNCEACGIKIYKSSYLDNPRIYGEKVKICEECAKEIRIIASALDSHIITYSIFNQHVNTTTDIREFMDINTEKIIKLLDTQRKKQGRIKINFELFCFLISSTEEDNASDFINDIKSFMTEYKVIGQSTNLYEVCEDLTAKIQERITEFQEQILDCVIQNVLHLKVNICSYPLSPDTANIRLPKDIKEKNAVIYVKSKDEDSFPWAIISALHPTKEDSSLVKNYPSYRYILNLKGIDLPVTIDSIPKFEKQNNISVNVYDLAFDPKKRENRLAGPLYYTTNKKAKHVNLLYLHNDKKWRYCFIKDMSQLVKNIRRTEGTQTYFCETCLLNFKSDKALKHHLEAECAHICINLPNEKSHKIKFEHVERNLKLPFAIYADSESILKPTESSEEHSEEYSKINTHKHIALSFAYYIKCSYNDSLSKFETCRGPDCAKLFIEKLVNDIRTIYENNFKMHPQQNNNKKPKSLNAFVPIFFHNLSKYDIHQFIKELAFDNNKIFIIPETKENYVSVSKHILVDETAEGQKIFMELMFLDSCRFLRSSLEKLVSSLSPSQLKETLKMFPDSSKFDLIKRKGVFPYDYIESFDKLNETKLPERVDFFNNLNKMDISEDDYKHACNVWDVFNCKTLGEYSDLYLKTDVMLLADIFENYRELCLKTFDLDPCYYVTASGFSWDAMLKHTGIEMDYLTDIDMIDFIRKGIRGDISHCSTRYARANNKYMRNNGQALYDPEKESTYVMVWEVNNMHGWSMTQFLPTSRFHWLSEEETKALDIPHISDVSKTGYIFEVDLEYCEELHDEHNEMPFCPEKIVPPGSKLKKEQLISNLYNKSKYVIHYRNLKQALKNGLKLIKIHRVLQFEQSSWLKDFVQLNILLGQKAESDFERDFYDSMINALYHKATGNNENFTMIRLATTWSDSHRNLNCQNWISKPNFHSCSIFAEHLVAVEMKNLEISYKKPIYLGFCLSEISKTLLYDFHYNFIKKKYSSKSELLHMEVDSLLYKIKTEDIYKDMINNIDKFDTSNYESENQFNISLRNKDVLGLMKDQNSGKIVWSFIGLKPKMYAFNVEGKLVKKAGYIKKSVIENEIDLQSYVNTLEKNKNFVVKQNEMTAVEHSIYTRTVDRVALSPIYNRRFIVSEAANTFAWGHYIIEKFLNKTTNI